ncbi:hypothetical protein Tco_0332594 [Tanacetum coccineum]
MESLKCTVFSLMLKSFNREDLEDLYKLVKAKYKSTRPVEDLDLLLWGDLKTMFDPHVEDQIWKNQQNYKVLDWKLYDSCGVHSLRMQHVYIRMLVEKRYLLIPSTTTDMLNKKLQGMIVGIKSLLNVVSITAALIDVNAAQSKLVLLENFNESYSKCLRLLYKVNVAKGVNAASEEVSIAELVSTAYVILFYMAQQVIPAAQLVSKYHTIGRCNNYTLPVETPENLFVTPVNIETIEVFMNKVGYQGVVDKVSTFYANNLAQPWQTMFKVFNRCLTTRTSGHDQTKINILQMFHGVINRTNVDYAALLWWDFINNVKQKKEAIQYPRFIKLIIADLMKKFPEIPKRIEEDYHSIKNDIPLVSVYTTRDVHVRGMLIPDAFLTEKIRATDNFKEYETVFMKGKKRKQSDGESKPGSYKDNPKLVDDDDDDKNDEKVNEEEGGDMGSLETKTEETQTTIPTTPRSPRTILSLDKNITQELTDTVPLI